MQHLKLIWPSKIKPDLEIHNNKVKLPIVLLTRKAKSLLKIIRNIFLNRK